MKYLTTRGETVMLVIEPSTSPICLNNCECLKIASNFVNSFVLYVVNDFVTSVTKVSFVFVVPRELNLKETVKNK